MGREGGREEWREGRRERGGREGGREGRREGWREGRREGEERDDLVEVTLVRTLLLLFRFCVDKMRFGLRKARQPRRKSKVDRPTV